MDNKVLFGLEKMHVAFRKTVETAPPEWEDPVANPGAVRFAATPLGEEVKFYADNVPYFVLTSNNGYDVELETANVPDALIAEMLGWEIDTNGMLVEVADATPKHFALMGQILGDAHNRRFVYYDCVASRPDKEHRTKGESIEPDTDKLKIAVLPIEIGGKTVVKGVLQHSDLTAAAYDAFFNGVLAPDGIVGAVDKSRLEATIGLAGKLTEADYTAGSWATLTTALTAATTIKDKAGATQVEVNAANKTLQAAILGLVTA